MSDDLWAWEEPEQDEEYNEWLAEQNQELYDPVSEGHILVSGNPAADEEIDDEHENLIFDDDNPDDDEGYMITRH